MSICNFFYLVQQLSLIQSIKFMSIGRGYVSAPKKQHKQGRDWFGASFKPENFLPGLIIGFFFGFLWNVAKPCKTTASWKLGHVINQESPGNLLNNNSKEDFKMVLVVRQDLKMRSGKIASQCAHAATGIYAELIHSHRSLLRKWEFCGQAKIVVTCKNQHEMNKLKDAAEIIGLPTFIVADAGRTQVSAGSQTVLAIGPGNKSAVDSVTGKLSLL